jgi:Uma2 family endonuclease
VPDVAVFQKSTILEQDGYIHSAPQVVIDVLSAANTRLEREGKLRDYADLGIPEVWVLAPDARTVEILYLEDGKLRRSAVLAEGLLKPCHFPTAQIDIAGIWPD